MTSAELARLDELSPAARPWFESLIRAMQSRGYDPFIGQVYRTPKQQHEAIVQGATSAHQIVSWHEIRRAVDFRRRLPDGTEDLTTDGPDDFWQALSAEANQLPGMRSLAYHDDGSKILLNGVTWDAGHVEYRAPFDTLAQAVAAEPIA